MSSNNAGYYFQTSDDLATSERKAAKATNKSKHGKPIKLPSKILALQVDPFSEGAIYVAEAAATVKRVTLEVCKNASGKVQSSSALLTDSRRVKRSVCHLLPRRL